MVDEQFIMKCIESDDSRKLTEGAMADDAVFAFDCNPSVSCFNRCCHNLNLFLYPYDVIRLKHRLKISSDVFLERHVDVVLRDSCYFPEVLLSMAELPDKPCPFLSPSGCSVYEDRPEACRMFPVEQGVVYHAASGVRRKIHFFKPPEFCQGARESKRWTVDAWIQDQGADEYNRMTRRWSEVKYLFQSDPWAGEGPNGQRGKMTFMAAYNMDQFRKFVFGSSFLKRYKMASTLREKIRKDDIDLLKVGLAWIELLVWGKPSSLLRPVKK